MIFHSFTVSNFRSIKEPLTLTMEAADVPGPSQEIDDRNLVQGPDGKYLKVKALYGGNAAGKSNIYKAVTTFFQIIREIHSTNFALSNYIIPHLLDNTSRKKATLFEVEFSVEKRIFRYGFEADTKSILSEWLYIKDFEKKEEWGILNGKKFKINKKYFPKAFELFPSSKWLKGGVVPYMITEDPSQIIESILLLPLLRRIGEPIAIEGIQNLLVGYSAFNLVDSFEPQDLNLKKILEPGPLKNRLLTTLRYADLNIVDFHQQPIVGKEGEELFSFVIEKQILDENGKLKKMQNFNFNQESDGTKRLFSLYLFLDRILNLGGFVFIDELDARFHPLLTSMIVELFQNPETNPKGAQLIFITHDTQFLSLKRFRPDQIAFVSRNKANATEISHLIEFEGIESDSDIRDLYMKGLLDGVPNLNLFLESFKRS